MVITADRVSDYLPGGALKLSMAEPLSWAISNIVLAAGGPLAIEGFTLERMVPLRGLEDYGGGTLVVAVFPAPSPSKT